MSTPRVPRAPTVRIAFHRTKAPIPIQPTHANTELTHNRLAFFLCFLLYYLLAATVRGALRAEREDLLTVVLPQSLEKQTKESQELLEKVDDLITMPQNDDMSLDVASRICNSYLLSLTDQLVSFAFHESTTVIEANKEAKALDMLVTTLYLD